MLFDAESAAVVVLTIRSSRRFHAERAHSGTFSRRQNSLCESPLAFHLATTPRRSVSVLYFRFLASIRLSFASRSCSQRGKMRMPPHAHLLKPPNGHQNPNDLLIKLFGQRHAFDCEIMFAKFLPRCCTQEIGVCVRRFQLKDNVTVINSFPVFPQRRIRDCTIDSRPCE